MADEILTFDAAASMPDGSDPGAPTNSPLSIGPGTSYPVTEASFPAPPLNVQYSSSVDTEGEIPVSRRYGNRTITLKVEMDESGANNTLLDALQVKFAKLQREGGTLKRTRKDGSTIRIYDIVAADGWDPVYDLKYLLGNSSEVTMTLPAKPLARGAEVDLGDNVETTLPCLVFTETGVTGDVPALGRLVIDNDVAADQAWVAWGIESRYYSSSANAALFYEAEGRTAMGGSAIAAGPAGASGAGSNVMRNTALTTGYQAILSTQATGGGAHLSHIGTFRVWARVQTPTANTGSVSVALEWGEGDFRRFTRNSIQTIDSAWEGTWRRLDLGLVSLSKVAQGAQRWEGRIVARSTVPNDDIDIDWLMLVPVAEGSGVARAVVRDYTPTAFSARDEFNQTAGALNAKVLPIGGSWVTSGSAADLQVSTSTGPGGLAASAATLMSVGTRVALAGTATFTNVAASVSVRGDDTSSYMGLHLRYTDANNNMQVHINGGVGHAWKTVAGVGTTLVTTPVVGGFTWPTASVGYLPITVVVMANGTWKVRFGTFEYSGYDADLATGGTLASGKVGLYANSTSALWAQNFDDFWVAVPPSDAALFASQSLEVRHDGVIREDSTGSFWQPPSRYEGAYLRIPPAGAEARTVRVITTLCRSDPELGPDIAIDDLSARLFVTPRFL